MKQNRKLLLGSLVGIMCFFLIIGVSYALWSLNLFQTNENVVTTDCFKINFTDKNNIQLNNAFPIEDEEGKKLTPYEFTITNTCNSEASYQVNLEILDTTTLMKMEYLKVMFDENVPRILSNYIEVNKTLENATKAYKLEKGKLNGNETKSYTLRLWMDEDTPPVEDAMNKIFKSKVTVTTSYKAPVDTTNMMVQRYDEKYNKVFDYSFMQDSHKIIFQTEMNPIEGVTPVDVSFNGDNTVLAYKDESNAEEIVTYIQANGKIKLPEYSYSLFNSYENLTEIIGLENLDTRNVTKMSAMFQGSNNITSLDLSTWDVSNVISMAGMFSATNDEEGNSLSQLTSLNLSNWNTSSLEDMDSTFANCINLNSLDLSSFDTSKVKNMVNLFTNCIELINVNLSGWNLKQNPDRELMFDGCEKLTTVNASNMILGSNMSLMFFGCINLTSLNLSGIDTTKVTDMHGMFSGCSSLTSLDLSSFDTTNVTDMNQMFSFCSSLTSLDLSGFDTTKVTNMYSMFDGCSSLISLDISTWDTTNVTDMNYIFCDCSSLSSLDLSSFDTGNVKYMIAMFSGCSNLTSLNLSHFNTSNVKYMAHMFYDCTNLESINLTNWDTSNVIILSAMFYNCSSLTTLDLSSYDTRKVEAFGSFGSGTEVEIEGIYIPMYAGMFENCTNLTTINYGANFIRNIFDTDVFHGNDVGAMYSDCPANKPTHSSWEGVTF